MTAMKRLRDLPQIASRKAEDEQDVTRRKRAIAARPATVKPFERMTEAEKDAALKALFLEHGLCT